MKVTKETLRNFIQSIPDRCRNERECILKPGQGKWDTHVRKSFAEALESWLCQHFSLSTTLESKRYVYAEGRNPIPTNLRGSAFFGTTMHPDAAIIIDDIRLVAIELDHGTKGSQVRNALAKAGFSVSLGKFDQAMVFFFVAPPKSPSDFEKQEGEELVLSLYEERFHTSLYII